MQNADEKECNVSIERLKNAAATISPFSFSSVTSHARVTIANVAPSGRLAPSLPPAPSPSSSRRPVPPPWPKRWRTTDARMLEGSLMLTSCAKSRRIEPRLP